VFCQLTEEWHLGVADSYEWYLYIANIHRNDICVLPTYTGMVFVCGFLTWEWRLCVANLTQDCVQSRICSVPRPDGDDRPVPCLQIKPAV